MLTLKPLWVVIDVLETFPAKKATEYVEIMGVTLKRSSWYWKSRSQLKVTRIIKFNLRILVFRLHS